MEQLPTAINDAMCEIILNLASGHAFHNTSPFTFKKMLNAPEYIETNPKNFIRWREICKRSILHSSPV